MAVRIEKDGPVWTIIHDRPDARNAMDPKSADAMTAAFLEFDANEEAVIAVLYGAGGAFCAGWDLKYVSTLDADYPLGELDISTARPRCTCLTRTRPSVRPTTQSWPIKSGVIGLRTSS